MPKSSSERDEQRLQDILDACESIAKFVQDHGADSFAADDMIRSAVLYKLMVIGEAAARLSDEFVGHHSDISWKDIVGMRNILVHEYFAVSWSIVWTTATSDVPALRGQLASIVTGGTDDEKRV